MNSCSNLFMRRGYIGVMFVDQEKILASRAESLSGWIENRWRLEKKHTNHGREKMNL